MNVVNFPSSGWCLSVASAVVYAMRRVKKCISYLLVRNNKEPVLCSWSKGEQSTALSTATGSSLQVCLLLLLKILLIF